MRLSMKLKHNFFSAFREFFVHHHGSLEFRAKVFALMISANEDFADDAYKIILDIGSEIYKGDKERANILMFSTKEKVHQVWENNGLDIDKLITSIQKDLRAAPRYAKKINSMELKRIMMFTHDDDIHCYQENILEFLEKLKNETLTEKQEQILKDEHLLNITPTH